MKNLNVFGWQFVFLGLISLRKARQRVCSSVCLALTIINSKLVMREFLSLADLFGAQTLRVHEPTKFVMVGKYQDFVLAAFQIVSLGLKNINDY